MNRQDAENIITEYLKPIFGFALKRCKNAHDAEDLSQDIVLKAFRALLLKDDTERVLSLYEHEKENLLSKEDYVWLSERGYIKTWGDYDGHFKTAWQIIVLRNKEIQQKLLEIGEKIKEKYKDAFDAIKAPYVEAVLNSVPTHLRKVKAYELQYVFHSDGWFLLHCIVTLLKNGKLTPPTEEQKKALTTIILPNS